MPQQHQLHILGSKLCGDGVQEWIRTMKQDDVRLLLIDDFLEVVIVGEGYVLTGNVQRRGYTIDFHAVDSFISSNAVLTETYNNIVEVRKTFTQILCNCLNATLYRIIIFSYLEYSFLHQRYVV